MSLVLRAEDRKLALVRRGEAALWHPEPLIRADFRAWKACIDDLIEERRIRVHTGIVADSLSSRARTWTARDITIGQGAERFNARDPEPWCRLFTHELRHPVEVPHHRKDGTLQLKYVFRVRFRWSIEMQADIAVMRWYRQMKVPRAAALKFAEDRAASYARPFPGYNMGRIRNLRRETVDLLMHVYSGSVP